MGTHENPPAASITKSGTGPLRIWNAFLYSLAGLGAAYRHEAAFRQETWLALVLVPTSLLLPASAAGHAMMIASVALVLIVELVNSAIEAIVDRVSPEIHPLSKRAKDIGSAAVFVALVNAVATWVLVLLP